MKHLLLLAILFAFSFSSSAQRVNGSYSASGGLLGAVNYNKLRITGENLNDTEYGYKVGWSLGAWLNLPLGNTFSLEPQVMYSLYVFNANNREALIPSGNLSYISIPLLLKIHPRDDIAFTLGPQFDLLGSVNDAPEGVTKDDFTSMNIALSAGVEFLPHIPVVLFARYIHGLSDLDNRNTSSEDAYLSTGF